MRLRPYQRVTYEVAKQRAIESLRGKNGVPVVASYVGMNIWPDNEMRAQGLGAAASRILKRMEKEELVRFAVKYIGNNEVQCWGYVLTHKGNKQEVSQ